MSPPTRYRPHPGTNPACRVCGGQGFTVSGPGAFAVATVCACVGPCPDCRDTGFVARGEGLRAPRVRCRCRTSAQRLRAYNDMGLPARHATSTLQTFEASDERVTPTLMKVHTWLRQYDPTARNRGLVLYGDVGRGKTHLMAAVLRELVLALGVTARFVEFSHLLADLRHSFDRGTGAVELLEPLSRVNVLAVDELGKGRNTEFEGTVLDELVTRRYNAGSIIVATTNYAPGPPTGNPVPNLADATGTRPRLVDRVGARVYSRLEEMSDFVPALGPDYRLKHRPWGQT